MPIRPGVVFGAGRDTSLFVYASLRSATPGLHNKIPA